MAVWKSAGSFNAWDFVFSTTALAASPDLPLQKYTPSQRLNPQCAGLSQRPAGSCPSWGIQIRETIQAKRNDSDEKEW